MVGLNLDCLSSNHDWDRTAIVALDAGKGGLQYRETCRHCGRRSSTSLSIAELKSRGINRNTVPVVRNRDCCTIDGCAVCSHPCAVCGTYRNTQQHHYWPQSIFGFDFSNRMATDWLCQHHHTVWHQKVTPQISQRVAA